MTKKRTSQKLPKILSRTDAKKILAIPNTKTLTGLKNRVILQVLYRTGLRVQEICNLTLADVNIKDGLIYVQQSKNKRDRYVPFDTQTAQWLLTWIKKHKGVWGKTYPSTHFFFPSNTGAKLNQSHIRRIVYNYAEKAGVYIQDGAKQVLPSPHNFRHTYATELLEEGYTVREVQALLGHKNITTTSIYLHVRPLALAIKIRNRTTI